MDAALLAGTGKDLLEAVAKHVVLAKWGQSTAHSSFPFLLGQAFTALDMAATADKKVQNETPMRRYERSLYELGCSVNAIRNKEGTGHGRPFLPTISPEEAANAVQAIGYSCGIYAHTLEKCVEYSKQEPIQTYNSLVMSSK